MKKHKFIVEVEIPSGVTITDMKGYIHNAIGFMAGAVHYEAEISFLNRKSIKVVHVTRAKASELLGEFILNQNKKEHNNAKL